MNHVGPKKLSRTVANESINWLWLPIFPINLVRGLWNKLEEMEFQNKGVVPVQIAPLLISQPTIKISVLNPSRTASKFKVFRNYCTWTFKFQVWNAYLDSKAAALRRGGSGGQQSRAQDWRHPCTTKRSVKATSSSRLHVCSSFCRMFWHVAYVGRVCVKICLRARLYFLTFLRAHPSPHSNCWSPIRPLPDIDAQPSPNS